MRMLWLDSERVQAFTRIKTLAQKILYFLQIYKSYVRYRTELFWDRGILLFTDIWCQQR